MKAAIAGSTEASEMVPKETKFVIDNDEIYTAFEEITDKEFEEFLSLDTSNITVSNDLDKRIEKSLDEHFGKKQL